MLQKFITATLAAISFSVVAMAQPITEVDAKTILSDYSVGYSPLSMNTCLDLNKQPITGTDLKEAFTVKQNAVVGLLNRGERSLAAGKANSALLAFGHCYSKASQKERPIYARFMGGLIATQALADDDNEKMQTAITLLDYAKSHGQVNDQFLNLINDHREKEIESSSDNNVSLVALQNELKSNALRFDKKYKNKSVTFDAIVKQVSVDRIFGGITLSFHGENESDIGSCTFDDGEMEDKLTSLDSGQSITITAEPYAFSGAMGDVAFFNNCTI